jgi:hypothetical protein
LYCLRIDFCDGHRCTLICSGPLLRCRLTSKAYENDGKGKERSSIEVILLQSAIIVLDYETFVSSLLRLAYNDPFL